MHLLKIYILPYVYLLDNSSNEKLHDTVVLAYTWRDCYYFWLFSHVWSRYLLLIVFTDEYKIRIKVAIKNNSKQDK